jgi:hypothetical protein
VVCGTRWCSSGASVGRPDKRFPDASLARADQHLTGRASALLGRVLGDTYT